MSVCIQVYVALHVVVSFKVECTSTELGMGCALWRWGEDGSKMYGDGVGTVVKYMGMEKNHCDGVGMGLIFNTVSLFSAQWLNYSKEGGGTLHFVSSLLLQVGP